MILTEKGHLEAIKRLNDIFNAEPGTPEGEELEILASMIEQYENIHYHIDEPKMTFKEATEYSINVEWKTTSCGDDNCWCEIIEPIIPITDKDGNSIIIVGAGSIPKEYARHIVGIHNKNIRHSYSQS